eukprot:COSAG06_NODE_42767_length_378_cov_1.516129_2_plen_25_part_01
MHLHDLITCDGAVLQAARGLRRYAN